MLITFEGIDGSGKTTQANRLKDYLESRGLKVHLFREPGGTGAGERIRDILLEYDLDPLTELFLFEASRVELLRVIREALSRGEVVVLDRFTDSTLAYQGYGRGLNLDLVKRLNSLATQGTEAEITFLLDLDPEIALRRAGRKSRFDDPEFLRKVREGYLEIARSCPHRVVVLDASLPEEEVFLKIKDRVDRKLNLS
ncbi:MAG: dTMP kinase [Aquificota bacterium]|nr:dTMP kinase [Aquificota bacterium]